MNSIYLKLTRILARSGNLIYSDLMRYAADVSIFMSISAGRRSIALVATGGALTMLRVACSRYVSIIQVLSCSKY